MRTLDRYLVIEFLKLFILCALGLTFLLSFQAMMSDVLEGTYPINQNLVYHALLLPEVFTKMVPPAVLMATVFTLSTLNRNNELTALYSIGFGITRIGSIFISVVFMLACLSLIIQDRIVPPFLKKRTSYHIREMQKKQDFYFDTKKDKVWYRSNQLIYNLKSFDTQTNTISGISIYSFDQDFKLRQMIEAEKGHYENNQWNLEKGTITVFTNEQPFPITQSFASRTLEIKETPKDFSEIEKEVDTLRLVELKKYIDRVKKAGTDVKAFQVKFHSRISMSLTPLIMCVIGIPFSIRNRREGSLAKDLGLCLGFTFFYWVFYSIGLSLGTNGTLLPWVAAWLPNIIFATIAVVLVSRIRR